MIVSIIEHDNLFLSCFVSSATISVLQRGGSGKNTLAIRRAVAPASLSRPERPRGYAGNVSVAHLVVRRES
jgi:hypothetical protein